MDPNFSVTGQVREQLGLPPGKIFTGAKSGGLYAWPARNRSSAFFKEGVRQLTRRGVPLKTKDLIEQTQPSLADVGVTTTFTTNVPNVRTLFNDLDPWIERRIGRIGTRAGAAVVGNSFRSVSRLTSMGWGNW